MEMNTTGNISNLTGLTCSINQEQWRDAVVIVRLVFSGLSIIGALSIIITVLVTRTAKKQTIHPLLALSIADLLLSLLLVTGGALWLGKVTMHLAAVQACLIISRLTLITYMAGLSTQLIYGTLAYLYIRKSAKGITSQPLIRNAEKPTVSRGKVSVAYMLAWAIPTIAVATPFIVISVDDAARYGSTKSCWCLPSLSNVLPYTFDKSTEAQDYKKLIQILQLSTAVPLVVLISIIMVALVAIYFQMWCFIKNKTNNVAVTGSTARSQELQRFITDQRKSFKRVIAFMTYFIILTVLILATLVGVVAVLSKDVPESDMNDTLGQFGTATKALFLVEAVVVPLQGFVNAVIFGWSRPTFLSGLKERLRAPATIVPQRAASLRDFYPVSSGSWQYATLPHTPSE